MIYGLNNQLIKFLPRHTLGQRDTHQFLQSLDRCWRAGRIHLCQTGFWGDGFGYGDGAKIKLVSVRVAAIFSTTGASGASLTTGATNQSDRGEG